MAGFHSMGMGDGDPEDDVFAGLSIDEDWVSGAAFREPSARSRSARVEIDRLAAEQDAAARVEQRRARRRRRRRRVIPIAVFVAFIAAVALVDEGDEGGAAWTAAPADLWGQSVVGAKPTPQPAVSDVPLGTPADPDAHGGSHAFLARQTDVDTPVAYDPCRPIAVVVNERTMPDGAEDTVEDALATLSEVTGLQIEVEGTTDEEPSLDRSAFQRDRYGDRWAPILVAWSDPEEIADLSDDVLGLGGSVWNQRGRGPRVYVTGLIYLDGPQLGQLMDDGNEEVALSSILHELGHVLGLDHVADDGELMFPSSQEGIADYQEGDRTGLTRLGQGECVPAL